MVTFYIKIFHKTSVEQTIYIKTFRYPTFTQWDPKDQLPQATEWLPGYKKGNKIMAGRCGIYLAP